MAQGYDADVQLSVGLSLEDVKTQSAKLRGKVEDIFKSVDSSNLTNQMRRVQASMSRVEASANQAYSEIERLENKKANTEYYEELRQEAERLAEQYNAIQDQIEATSATDLRTRFALEEQAEQLASQLQPLVQEMYEMSAAGQAIWTDQDTMRLDRARNTLGDLNNQQRLNIASFQQLQEQQQREQQTAEEAARLEREHAEALQRTREAAGELDPAIANTVNRLRELNEEENRIRQRMEELGEAEVNTPGYAEYNQLNARMQQIANERRSLNQEIQQYNQEQLDALNAQQREEERLRQAEEERARAQERCVAIIRGELNPEIANTVDRYNQVGQRIRELETSLQRMEQEGRGLGYTQYDNTVRELEQLRHEYAELQHGIDEYSQSLSYEAQERQRLEAEAQQYIATAQREDEEMAQLSDRYAHLGRQLEIMRQRQQELLDMGIGAGYTEYDRLTGAITRTQEEYDRLGEEIQAYNNTIIEANRNTQTFREQLAQFGHETLDNVRNGLRQAIGHFAQFINHLHRGHGAANRFGNSLRQVFRRILTLGLGVASVTALLGRIRSAVTQNIKYFAQFNNGNNQVNASISQLMSSLNALKGSLAAAFVPIVTVVSPILSNFIDQLASVINAIGMFIARLTGAKSYMMAVKTSTNYATSGNNKGGGNKSKTLEEKQAEVDEKRAKEAAKAEEKEAEAAEKLAKAQEEANKQLAGFDELNNLSLDSAKELADYTQKEYDDPTDTGGGGAGAPFGFEEVPLDGMEWNWDDLLAKAEEFGRKFADMLNDIFADEDLAKKIGNAIGNLINMAIAFAYGFVSRFDFHQFGRWLGVLLQEAIDTIRWDVLGMTIGEALNGIADTVIGFFETYEAGSLGDALATMFNNAIDRIVPEKLGEALADVLKAPFIELKQFLTTANMELAGEKFRRFFIETLQNKVLGNETLGQTIGTGIATLINRAVAFFLAMDVSKMVAAITKFFNDIFFSAIKAIDWPSLGELLYALLIGTMIGVFQGVADFVDKAVRLINPDWADALDVEGFNYWLDENFGSWNRYVDTLENGVKTLDGMMTPVEAGLASLNSKLEEFNNGTAVNWKQSLREIQAEYSLTDEEMQTAIDLFIGQDNAIQDSSEILEGYTGDWSEYKETIKDVPMFIKPTTEQQKLLDDAIKDTGESVNTTKDEIVDYVSSVETSVNESKAVVDEYSVTTTEALDAVGEKSKDVKADFVDMTSLVSEQTEALTATIEKWYNATAEEYFTFDRWYTLLNSSVYASMELTLTEMFELWNTSISEWETASVLPMFTLEKWLAIFTPIRTAWMQVWDSLYRDWTIKFTAWWTATLIPSFAQQKWEKEFNHVNSGAEKSFNKVVDTIEDKMNEAVEIVLDAAETMSEALQGILETVDGIVSALGGLGSLNLSAITINVPHLAQGAVIPPNQEFMAVLGDQKSGTNVEAPLDTIKQAVAETLNSMNYRPGGNEDIVIQIDGYEVFRAVREQNDRFRSSTGYSVL